MKWLNLLPDDARKEIVEALNKLSPLGSMAPDTTILAVAVVWCVKEICKSRSSTFRGW